MIQSNDEVRMQAATFVDMGIELVKVPAATMPNTPDLSAFIDYGFRTALDAFLADLSDEAPAISLAQIVEINSAESADRAPYGQGYLESDVKSPLTVDESAAQVG